MFSRSKPGDAIALVKEKFVKDKIPKHDLEALKRLKKDILPVEQKASQKIDEAIANYGLSHEFPPIDLNFLRMRKRGWPTFAVYPVWQTGCQQGECSFSMSVDYRGQSGMSFTIPKVLYEYFDDVRKKLRKRARRLRRATMFNPFLETRAAVKISHVFTGLIPHSVRQQIKQHKDKFNQMILVEEANKWKVQEKVEQRERPRHRRDDRHAVHGRTHGGRLAHRASHRGPRTIRRFP